MSEAPSSHIRRWVIVAHRDVGYLVASFVLAYCASGLALNHIDLWNPDFIVEKKTIAVSAKPYASQITPTDVAEMSALVGQQQHRVYDSPTPSQLKIYYQDASLHVDLATGNAQYERVKRRPLFYQLDVLHRNSFKPWRWLADFYSVLLILVTVTGLIMMRGRNGFGSRGKWFFAFGLVPPTVALILHG